MNSGNTSPQANLPLRDFAASILGSGLRIEDRSRSFGRQSVLWQITDSDGNRFWLKRHDLHYKRELNALENWVPLLGDATWWRSSEVIGKSDDLEAMVLTNVEGGLLDETGVSPEECAEMFFLAGKFARKLHDVEPVSHDLGDSVEYFAAYGERYLAHADGVLDAETMRWARDVWDGGSAFNDIRFVRVHMDYSPRNWIIDRQEEGIRFGVIDWERARIEYWLHDTQRMQQDHFYREPALKESFFDGYGHQLTDGEERHLQLLSMVGAIGAVPWAIEYGDKRFAQNSREIVERLRQVL